MYESPKTGSLEIKGAYKGSTPARRCYVGGTLVFQAFSPASEQEFIEQTAAGGPAQLLKVYGKSVVNNQLVPASSQTLTAGGTTAIYTLDGKITITGSATSSVSYALFISVPFVEGHKYYLAGCPAGGSNRSFSLRYNSNGFGENGDGKIVTYSTSQGESNYMNRAPIVVITNYTITGSLVFRPRLIDLTLRFGAGNEPTSVDEALRLLGGDAFDPTYDPGSIQSNAATELRAYDGGNLRGSLALNLSTLTSGGVAVFPDGMCRVGSIRDEAEGSTAIKRITRVDLSTLPWAAISSPASHIFRIYRTDLPEAIKPPVNDNALANAYILGYKQLGFSPISASDDMCFAVGASNRIVIINHACSTIAQFEAAVSGLYMYYELDTPGTYTLDTPLPTDLTCVQGDILQRVSDNNCPFVGEMKFGL